MSLFLPSQPCYPGVECSLIIHQDNNAKNSWTMSVEYSCGLCPDGMVGNGVQCSRTDPCESNPCYPGATCTMIIDKLTNESIQDITNDQAVGRFSITMFLTF